MSKTKTKTTKQKLMTEDQVKQALFDEVMGLGEPAKERCWNGDRYVPTAKYEGLDLNFDNQLLLKSIANLIKKQPKKVVASFEVSAKDFSKIKESVADSCMDDETKDAIAKAMGVTFNE